MRRLPRRVWEAIENLMIVFIAPAEAGITFKQMQERYPKDLQRYRKYLRSSQTQLSRRISEHRRYYSLGSRGFTNPGNYMLWKQVLSEYRPFRMLEIGVYRGQTMSLWQLLASELGYEAEICGLSPLTSGGDEIGKYLEMDYEKDILENFREFRLPDPELIPMRSDDPKSRALLRQRRFELIFIDGSHDYEIVKSDLEISLNSLEKFGLLVLDDSMRYRWNSPKTSLINTGHPGPSRVADEMAVDSRLVELGSCGHNRVFQRTS